MKILDRHSLAVVISVLVISGPCSSENASSSDEATRWSPDHAATPADKRIIELQDMFALYDLGGMGWQGLRVSPDGKRVAFQMHRANVEENDYDAAWYILDLTKSGEPGVLGDAGDPLLFRAKTGYRINGAWVSTYPVWSPDSRWVAYRRMDHGSVQVWRSSIDGSIREKLTESPASIDAFRWSEDGKQIWYETDATLQEQANYLQSITNRGVWIGDNRFDRRLLALKLRPYDLTSGQPMLWVLDLFSRQARLASADESLDYFTSNSVTSRPLTGRPVRLNQISGRPLSSHVKTTADGERIAWLEAEVQAMHPNRSIHTRLRRVSDVEIRCEFVECRGYIRKLFWSRDGREIVFIRAEGPSKLMSTIYSWQVDKNIVRRIYTANSHHLSACDSTGHSLVCFSDEAGKPRVMVEIQFADGSVAELFDPNPQFAGITVGDAELISWKNTFDIETLGWFIKPVGYEDGKRYPLVIVQYNASFCFQGGTGHEYPSQLFAAYGFAVLCFNQPMLPKTEILNTKEYYRTEAWPGYYQKRVYQSSLHSAIDLLDERGVIDPARVGITGLSSGADTISYSLSHSERFATAIVASLSWSPIGYFFLSGPERTFYRSIGLGRPGGSEDKYWSGMTPGMNVDRISTPLLIQVSDDEARGTIFNYVTLREYGKAIDMYIFPDEYHVKWYPRNRLAAAERSVDWMRFWLKDEEDRSSVKAEQYARWRGLRQEQRLAVQPQSGSEEIAGNRDIASD